MQTSIICDVVKGSSVVAMILLVNLSFFYIPNLMAQIDPIFPTRNLSPPNITGRFDTKPMQLVNIFNATNARGTSIRFEITTVDSYNNFSPANCTHSSGFIFPIGKTYVIWSTGISNAGIFEPPSEEEMLRILSSEDSRIYHC